MIDVLFDQYQRYQNVTNIINSMRVPGQVFNILEVGANEHQNLEKFLPIDQITYLDIQLPENLRNNPKYILGDATSMDFPDNHYNIVVALDVFEHIFEENREKFLNELYRVSSDFFVITAPFYSPEVVETERRVNAVYKSIFGKDFIWLEEHMANGLPDLTKMCAHLKAQNIRSQIINHGDLRLWERLMTIHFIAAQDARLGIYRNEIDRFYNQHLFESDFIDTSYRKVCVALKNDNLAALSLKKIDLSKREQDLLKLDELEKIFYSLAELSLKLNTNHISEDFVQVFIDEGIGYAEHNSIKFNLEGNMKHVKTNLDSQKLKSIRIDPSNYKGSYEIRNLRVALDVTDNHSKKIYIIKGNFDFNFGNTFVFYEDDPFIILSFMKEESVKEISFDIIKLIPDEAVVSIVNHFSRQIELIEENEKLLELECEKKIGNLEQRISDLSATNTKLTNTNQSLISDLENKKNSNSDLSKTLSEFNQINEELHRTNEKLSQTILDLQQTNNEVLTELDSIYKSKGWIYLSKLKRIVGK